jgi:predicted DNA-binding transcriptional regulator AlpA
MASQEWAKPTDLAAEFGVPIKTVYGWNLKGTCPKRYRLGRHVRYRRSDIEAWLEQQAEMSADGGDAA